MVIKVEKTKRILYYGLMLLLGIFGFLYFLFFPNLVLFCGSTIFLIIGAIYTINIILKKELQFGFLGHFSFLDFLFFVFLYFIELKRHDFDQINTSLKTLFLKFNNLLKIYLFILSNWDIILLY